MLCVAGTTLLGLWLLSWNLDTRPPLTSLVLLLAIACYVIDPLRRSTDGEASSLLKCKRSLIRWGNRYVIPETFRCISARAGTSGLVLIIFGRRMTFLTAGTHIAWVICGFVGVLLIAISLAFGSSIIFRDRLIRRDAVTSQSEL